MKLPLMLVSNELGNIFEIPGIYMIGMSYRNTVIPNEEALIELPYGSNLFMLPSRTALGFDPKKQKVVSVTEYAGERVFATAAFMAPAYLQIHSAAYVSEENATRLPLYSYTAAGFRNDKFFVSGMRIDSDTRQDLNLVDLDLVKKQALAMKKRYKGNRLVEHLVDNCVFCYGCPAARNFALERYECPLPTSITCNSKCLGCLSKQPDSSKVTQSQNRITFVPDPLEIAQIAVPHLERAERAVVSFGQGCEGEPLIVSDTIEEAIREIRKKTKRGIINLNTNGSKPDAVSRLLDAGLDSIRVSLNSGREEYYNCYFSPGGYSFADVMNFMFPGFTDTKEETDALSKVIRETRINMIQTRNINIDPEWYMDTLGAPEDGDAIGMSLWVELIRRQFPWIKLGYFNPPAEEMKKEHYPAD
jgi:hypothetical protein